MAKKVAEPPPEELKPINTAGRLKGRLKEQFLHDGTEEEAAQRMRDAARERGYDWPATAEEVRGYRTDESKPKRQKPTHAERDSSEPTVSDLVALKKAAAENGVSLADLQERLDDIEKIAVVVGGLDSLKRCLVALELLSQD